MFHVSLRLMLEMNKVALLVAFSAPLILVVVIMKLYYNLKDFRCPITCHGERAI